MTSINCAITIFILLFYNSSQVSLQTEINKAQRKVKINNSCPKNYKKINLLPVSTLFI